jgi:hypothetical protein
MKDCGNCSLKSRCSGTGFWEVVFTSGRGLTRRIVTRRVARGSCAAVQEFVKKYNSKKGIETNERGEPEDPYNPGARYYGPYAGTVVNLRRWGRRPILELKEE